MNEKERERLFRQFERLGEMMGDGLHYEPDGDWISTEYRRMKNRHNESNLQIACVRWFRCQYPKLAKILFSVPNGGTRNSREAQFLKAEGVTAGVSDLILLKPNGQYPYLCIEMKAGRNKQTQHQIEFQQSVEKVGGKYVVCRSVEEFITEINQYLKAV